MMYTFIYMYYFDETYVYIAKSSKKPFPNELWMF